MHAIATTLLSKQSGPRGSSLKLKIASLPATRHTGTAQDCAQEAAAHPVCPALHEAGDLPTLQDGVASGLQAGLHEAAGEYHVIGGQRQKVLQLLGSRHALEQLARPPEVALLEALRPDLHDLAEEMQ